MPSHRRYSSTSYILKKKPYTDAQSPNNSKRPAYATPSSLPAQFENTSASLSGDMKSKKELSSHSDEQGTQLCSSSRDSTGRQETISLLDEPRETNEATHTTSPTTLDPGAAPCPQLNQLNESSKSGIGQQYRLEVPVSTTENNIGVRIGDGERDTLRNEELKRLLQQVADMQVDIDQLLQYTQVNSESCDLRVANPFC